MKTDEDFERVTKTIYKYLDGFDNEQLRADVQIIITMFTRLVSIKAADKDTELAFVYLLNKIYSSQDNLVDKFYK